MEFSRVERAAIEAILSKPVDGMEVLRTQFAAASVVERDYTGVGFFTTISVPSSVPPAPNTEELHDALFDGAQGSPGVSFMLWIHDGYLASLEGVALCGPWPNEDEIQEVKPCRIVRRPSRTDRYVRPSDEGLMPDCESRFEVRRPDTILGTLLEMSLLAASLVILATVVVILHRILVWYTTKP
jgi:hypothetical protein